MSYDLQTNLLCLYFKIHKTLSFHALIYTRLRLYLNKPKHQTLQITNIPLTLPMLRLLSSKAQGCKDFWEPSKSCHAGIHWVALTEYSQMSTHLPGSQSFSGVLHHFVLAKLATSSIKIKTSHLDVFFFSFLSWFPAPISGVSLAAFQELCLFSYLHSLSFCY